MFLVQQRSEQFQTFKYFSILILICITLCHSPKVYAQEEPTKTDIDESFDPFTDYNEYDQQTEEEEDINFLKNGRYLTFAFVGGYRGFLNGGFTQAYTGNINFGAEFSYFFNMQLALTASYLYGDHNVNFKSYNDNNFTSLSKPYSGTVNIQVADILAKYYLNTDNVTKGLADLNPYMIVGTSYYIRTYNLDNANEIDPDRVWGLKIGSGIEIPILKRRGYFGIQGAFRYVQFPDENKAFIDEGTSPKKINPSLDGDIYDITFLVGFNF